MEKKSNNNEIDINSEIITEISQPTESSVSLNTASSTVLNYKKPETCKKRFCNAFTIRNNIVAFVILCLCALMQNVVIGGANNAILTTIERAYYMTSIESAVFLTLYDVANIIASPIIGYFGDKLHKPTVIGLSMVGLSLGSIITTIPEFLSVEEKNFNSLINNDVNNTDNNSLYYTENQLCYDNSLTGFLTTTTTTTPSIQMKSTATCGNSFLNNLKYVFFLANMVNGVASVALYTTAISYIENIFSSKKAPLCQGIYYAIGAIGIGVGMLATGNLLNINASASKKNPKKMDSNNVNWIGAWWIIYAINAFVSFVLALLVLRFGKNLVLIKTRSNNTANTIDENSKTKSGFKYHLKQFKASGYAIVSNKCYIFIVICTTFETLLIKGYSSYLTKYLEYQYRLPASTATMIAGGIGFVSLIGGALLGAFLIKKYNWGLKQCTKFTTCVLFLTCGLFLGLVVHCPQEKTIGVDYLNENTQFLLNKNLTCNCDQNIFNPVCYKTTYLFVSPCYAGCTNKSDTIYENCHLLNQLVDNYDTNVSSLKLELCSRPASHCKIRLVIVCLIGFLVLFMSSIVLMPILKIILESVDVESQSFALGIRSLVTKLFGNIPGPLIFAAIVDKSCVHWITRACTGNKTCRLYNNKMFSLGLGILGCGFRFLSACFALITLLIVSRSTVFNPKNNHVNNVYSITFDDNNVNHITTTTTTSIDTDVNNNKNNNHAINVSNT